MPPTEFDDLARDNATILIGFALAEDLGAAGDVTSNRVIPADARGSARFATRAHGVVAGLPVVTMLAERIKNGLRFEALMSDGDEISPGAVVATVDGPMRAILAFERTALNFLQRLSGIATLTARYVSAVADLPKARILDTRKTTPGWRFLEKYAVRCGGGVNHRLGLYDGVLIKDNHLAWLADSPDPIGLAVSKGREGEPTGLTVEVEVDSLDQLDRALEAKPDIVLLDNFGPEGLAEAVRRRDARAPSVLLEASGGINLDTLVALARSGVDRISVGALTHSAPALDIGLDFDRPLPP